MAKMWSCPHCHATRVNPDNCVTCNRTMCESCISYGDAGHVCGLCKDREDGQKRYDREYKGNLTFDEWYDINA